jgi:hypothetical protein
MRKTISGYVSSSFLPTLLLLLLTFLLSSSSHPFQYVFSISVVSTFSSFSVFLLSFERVPLSLLVREKEKEEMMKKKGEENMMRM